MPNSPLVVSGNTLTSVTDQALCRQLAASLSKWHTVFAKSASSNFSSECPYKHEKPEALFPKHPLYRELEERIFKIVTKPKNLSMCSMLKIFKEVPAIFWGFVCLFDCLLSGLLGFSFSFNFSSV